MPPDRSLAPREYGAYAELIFPVATGLALGGVTLAGVGFTGAALVGFLMSEPLALIAGARGQRARADAAPRARRRTILLGALGVLAGLGALVAASGPGRIAALVPAALGSLLLPTLVRGGQKRLGAELLVAAALSSLVLPVGLAGGAGLSRVTLAWGVWLAVFWLATLTVHAIKTRVKPALGARWTLWAAPGLAAAVAGLALAGSATGRLSPAAGLAVVPATMVAVAALVGGVTPRHLRRVGWSLVAANVATFGLLLVA